MNRRRYGFTPTIDDYIKEGIISQIVREDGYHRGAVAASLTGAVILGMAFVLTLSFLG